MSNEIKLGDKVRVSDATPWIYTRNQYKGYDCKVEAVAGDGAIVSQLNVKFPIPTKYLVKVDAEAKEAKYHKDDKVCINKSSLKHGLRGEILTIIGVDVSDRTYYVQSRCMRSPIWLREDEISPYTEPTEQTEAEKKPYDGISEETANEISNMLEAYAKALSGIADSFDWQRYEADLAKEIALKVANKFNAPHEAAEYATDIAKAVVEGLKRK